MGGGIIQLVSTGIPDLYLTGDPQITWFKVLYRRYTEFSMVDVPINIKNNLQFGDTCYVNIGNIADKLNKITMVVDIPTPEFTINTPTVKRIKDILKSYDIDYTKIEGLPQDDNICINYEILFGKTNDGPLSSYLINNTLTYNFIYNIKIDILEYFDNLYDLVDDRYIGKYVAIKANNIPFNLYGSNIDPEGYLLLTDRDTRNIINISTNKNTVDWDEKSFLYKVSVDSMNRDIIDISVPTIDNLIRIYPRQLGTYEVITKPSDFIKYINDGKKHHLIISSQYIKKCKNYNIALYDRYSKIEPDNNIDIRDIHNTYIQQKNRPLLFTNLTIDSLFYETEFEMGIYTFNIENLSESDYLNSIRHQIDNITVQIKIKDIDRDNRIFNRYDLNENIIYDPDYIVTGYDTNITTDETEDGFWIIKVDDIIDKKLSEDDKITINLNKIETNMDKIGFPSYKIIRKWDKSIVYNVAKLIEDTQDNNLGDTKNIKIDNMVSGITTISKIVRSIYDVPNVALLYSANINDTNRYLIPNFTDVINFHGMIIALQDDLLNSNTENRNYRLSNSQLYNADSIKKKIYYNILTDIIYVDQKKLGYNFMNTNTQFFRKTYIEDFKNDIYVSNHEYKYNGDVIESTEHNRDIIYRYTKFILFSYHIENLLGLSDMKEIEEKVNELSIMLTHISIYPNNIDPETEIPDVNNNIDISTEDIRFTLHNITYDTSIPYQDDTIIENMDNIYRDPIQNITSYIDNEYIRSGKRYTGENNTTYNSIFRDGVGTCINREIEFYHTMYTIDLTFNDDHFTETIYEYILEMIEKEYDYEENYKNTYSFKLTNEYLETYYNNISLISVNVNIKKITENILKIIENGMTALYVNYNRYVFLLLANNTYNNSEIEPQNRTIYNDCNTYIDYNANYIKAYMGSDKNPILMRNRYYNGIDNNYRLCITYIFSQQFNSINEESYNVLSSLKILNYRINKETNNILNEATFKDSFTGNIDNQININDNSIKNIIKYDSYLNEYINIEYWYDFADYMKNYILPVIICDLKDGYGTGSNDNNNDFSYIVYNDNTFILNHCPVVLTWYYGDKLQFIIEQLFEKDRLTYECPPELLQYNDIPINDVDDFENTLNIDNINPDNKGYLYKGISNITDDILALRFMGTDVRLNPECQIHGKIRNLPYSDKLFKLFDYYLVRNNIPGERISPVPIDDIDIREQCPLCFKTYCYMNLFNNNIRSTLFNNDDKKTHINDNDKINEAINSSIDNTKLMFFARPENIQYDDVTQTYFHTTMEFTIYRLITILFRYSRMINNIILMNNNEYDNFKIKMINNVNNIELYNNYIDYITELRDSKTYDIFQEQIKNLIKIIGLFKTDNQYSFGLNAYNNITEYTPSKYYDKNYDLYKLGKSYINSNQIYDSYTMIKNIKYNEPETTVTRHQLYRGNMIIWILIQKNIIDNYNNYFNNILNPVVTDLNIDVSYEIYNILTSILPKNMNYTENTIDYYRLNRYNSNNDFDNTISKMITTCREFMIYYIMILYRYKSMSFLLSFSKISLDVYQYYYDFTENIFAAYFDEIKETIRNFKRVDINPYNDYTINSNFYENDTSRYYYIESDKFTDNFDYNKNDNIRQGFTYNQYNNLLRMLGIHEQYILNENISSVIIDYNNDFEKYTTFIDNIIPDNTEIYNYEKTLIVYDNNLLTTEKTLYSKSYINIGVFNRIWYNCPTISTFLYDSFYRSSLLKVIDNDNNINFQIDLINDKLFTNSLFTSPYIYIRDKLIFSPINRFGHTDNVKEWEYDMYNNVETNIERLYEMRGVYVTYQYLFGDYQYIDIRLKIRQIYNYIFNDSTTSLVDNIETYIGIINGLINDVVSYIGSVSKQELTILISHIVTKYTPLIDNWNNSLKKIIEFYESLLKFNFFGGISANQQFKISLKNIIDPFRNTMRDILPQFTAITINSPITIIIGGIKTGKTSEDISFLLNSEVTIIKRYVADINILFSNVDNKISMLENTAFVKTGLDNRKYMPSQLYAMRSLSYFNNFEHYNDGLTLMASSIISQISAQEQVNTDNVLYVDNESGINIINTSNTLGTVPILLDNNKHTKEYIYTKSRTAYIESAKITLNKMNSIAYLDRYVINRYYKIAGIFNRYIFNNNIATRDTKLKVNNVMNYTEYKQKLLNINHNKRNKDSKYIPDSLNIDILQYYIDTELHNNLVSIFNRREPEHAWVRYLGYRMIESVSVIIDGEEIDTHNDELLLLLHTMNDNIEHKRGINYMIGHIDSMYKISRNKRPAMRLYVPFKFWFCKDYGNSLPLVGMIYSNIQLKIKLRKFEELFYMEKYAELKKRVKIRCHLIGNHIYLGSEERKIIATTRNHSLIERFSYSGTLTRNINNIHNTNITDNGLSKNILSVRYYFTDPCKYMIWKVSFDNSTRSDKNKIYWDKSNLYSINGEKIILKDIIKRTLIRLNGKIRETWKDNSYFQILQPYNKQINALDNGCFFYGFCLYPKNLQPSGTTNLTEIEDIRFLFEINDDIIDILKIDNMDIKIKMWTCSYNIFITASGFGALGFYGN